jgi:N-acetylglucosaminyl-diphospho-decaprenol L-rhamnosyltransferase
VDSFAPPAALRTPRSTILPVDCSIIIVNWNVCTLLRRCLASVPASAGCDVSYEVIVVDNASHDGSVAMVQAEFPAVRLLANSTNRGFAGGNNQGIAASRGRALLLLNPDTTLAPGALAVLLATLDAQPQVGLVGPRLRNPDGTVQPSRRRFPSLATALIESTPLQPYIPALPLLQRYYLADQPDDQEQEVDWLTGACLLVRRTVLQQVGGFDERYFMYSEELDLCRRVRAAGWRILYQPAAEVVHYEGQSSGQDVAARQIRFNRSKVRYFLRWQGRGAAAGLRVWLLALYAWQGALEAGKWLLGHKRPLRATRLRMIAGILRNGLRLGRGRDV